MNKFTFILLRGLGREGRHWGTFIDLLGQASFCNEILTIDCPGTGTNIAKPAPWRIPDYVDKLREEILGRSLKAPIILVGLSLGGMFAFEWFSRFSDEIYGCALLNSSMASRSPFYRRLQVRAYPLVLRSLFSNSFTEREKNILSLVSNFSGQNAKVQKLWIEIQKTAPVSKSALLKQLFAASHYAPKNQLAVGKEKSLLVLCGKKDRLVDYRCSLAIAEFYRCAYQIHPNAGHDLPLDDGAWIIEQLKNFVEGL